MESIVKYSLFFRRDLKIYYGHFTINSDNLITDFIFTIYNINELTMNPEYEYKFDDNIMYMKQKKETEWDKQNMSNATIESRPPILTVSDVNKSYNCSHYAIFHSVDDILIEARIAVDNTNKLVTDFFWKYSNINCLSMNHNEGCSFKYINSVVYICNQDTSNEYQPTTWSRVFNINEIQISDLVIQEKRMIQMEEPKTEPIIDNQITTKERTSQLLNTISQPQPQPRPQNKIIRPVQMKIQQKQKQLGPTEVIYVPKEPVFKMFDAGR
jgi:hypothetical protein